MMIIEVKRSLQRSLIIRDWVIFNPLLLANIKRFVAINIVSNFLIFIRFLLNALGFENDSRLTLCHKTSIKFLCSTYQLFETSGKFFIGLLIGSVVATIITSALTSVWQTRYTDQLTVHDFLTYIVPSGQVMIFFAWTRCYMMNCWVECLAAVRS